MSNYREEFPDYPEYDFPEIPEGFEDSSWHNDVCPSLVSDEYQMTVWLDYADPEKREVKGYSRFIVEHQRDGVETGRWSEAADTWSDALAIINRRKRDLRLWRALQRRDHD